jgi:SAM-dependent MidA family methyltransferase
MAWMSGETTLRDVLRNLLQYGDLTFRDFMELALYHPEFGYYSRPRNPVGKPGDFVTAPSLSPVFSFAIAGLVREFLSRTGGETTSVVDIGCGDGALINSVAGQVGGADVRFFGLDRSFARAKSAEYVTFLSSIDQLPPEGVHLLLSNELFDAFPFARLVQRGEHVHELWVAETETGLDWSEHEAPAGYEDYFAARGIQLADGQFADVSLEWEAFYDDMAAHVERGLIVTIDYGFPGDKLFHTRMRRFGTAAAYAAHRVSRDLLANPGEQDLTAHVNFTDLERAGERHGFTTLYFDRLAKFLLAIGATSHPLFTPIQDAGVSSVEDLEERDEARRLILPDGIGEDLRVLVQGKGIGLEGWSFQRPLF